MAGAVESAAPAPGAPSAVLEQGTYEVIRSRLTAHGTDLRERLGWTVLPANTHLAVLPGGLEGPADEDLSAVSLGISSLLSAALARPTGGRSSSNERFAAIAVSSVASDGGTKQSLRQNSRNPVSTATCVPEMTSA